MHRPPSAIRAGLTLAREPYADDGPRWVVAQAEAEIVERYGGSTTASAGSPRPCSTHRPGPSWWPAAAMPPDRRSAGSGCAPSARASGRSAASGSTPAARGQGVARALMAGIEDAARDLGLTDLRLGTGDRQPEAVALYESTGWERVLFGATAARCPLATSGSRSCWLGAVTTDGAPLRAHLRNRAGDHPGPHPGPAPDRRAQPGRHHLPHSGQPHRAGHRLERGRRARGAADGRSLHRLPQRPRPQPARLPARPPDGGGLRRGPVPLRLRRRAAGRRAHERAQRADHAGRGSGVRRRVSRGAGDRKPMRFGAATGLRPLPAWKRAADFLCVQVGFSLDDLLGLAGRAGDSVERRTCPSTPA